MKTLAREETLVIRVGIPMALIDGVKAQQSALAISYAISLDSEEEVVRLLRYNWSVLICR